MQDSRWTRWGLVLASWVALGVFFATQSYLVRAYWGRPFPFSKALQYSLTIFMVWAALTPPVVWVTRRLAALPVPLWRLILLHLAAGSVFSVAYNVIRTFLWPVLKMNVPVTISLFERFQTFLQLTLPRDVLIYLGIVGIWHGLAHYRRYRARALHASQLETRLTQARLQTLSTQLHPHFLFNTLHAISALVHSNVAAAERILARLSDLLRLTLQSVQIPQVTVKQEFEFLEGYLEIEQTRFQDRLRVALEPAPETLDALLPTMLLQPLVENAIRHGIAPRAAPGSIVLRSARVNGRLRLEVRDSGPGVAPDWKLREGAGLSNTRARLAQLYGREHSFALGRAPEGGLLVAIEVPFCAAENAALETKPPLASDAAEEVLPAEPAEEITAGSRNSVSIFLPSRRWQRWLLILGAWTVTGLYFAGESYSYSTYLERPTEWWRFGIWWLTNFYIWAALTPLVLLLVRRFAFEPPHRRRDFGIHTLGSLSLAALHSAIWIPVAPLVDLRPMRPNMSTWEIYTGYLAVDLHFNILSYWAILGIWHAVQYCRKSRERQLAAAQLERGLTQARLEALRMQLQPHFLFNTLHGISTLMHRDAEAANRLIVRLSDLLRLTLEHTGAQEIPLKRELEFLEPYLEIERTRFQDRLTVSLEIDPATLDACVPCLILQPLVENAVRHGIAPQSASGHIEIRAQRQNGMLRLEVRDDGVGLRQNGGREGSGIGLGNTRARLEHLYGRTHRFELKPAPGGGLVVSLAIPFHEYQPLTQQPN
ncbi:MAG TPA: histidine kinase [Terriglobales bacterium]|nr:histidine kinase [Terriglobales bacterium]